MNAAASGPRIAYVYRLYDAGDELLYVGKTVNLEQRMRSHARTKAWWPDVRRVESDEFATADLALAHEAFLITTLRPRHNIALSKAAPCGQPMRVMTVEQAAVALGISKQRVRRLVRAGVLDHLHFWGRTRVLVRGDSVAALIKSGELRPHARTASLPKFAPAA